MEFRHNIPVGTKIDCVKIIGTNGGSCPGATREAEVFLVVDNVYGILDLSLVDVPKGYERAGDKPGEWFREPTLGELFISATEKSVAARIDAFTALHPDIDRRRIILRKKTTKKRFVVAEFELPAEHGRVTRVFVETINDKHGYRGQYSADYRIEEREV